MHDFSPNLEPAAIWEAIVSPVIDCGFKYKKLLISLKEQGWLPTPDSGHLISLLPTILSAGAA